MKKLLFVLASVAMVALTAVSAVIAFTPEHSHNYTAKVTKEATCTTDGEITYTCSCEDSFVKVVGATGHSFGEHVDDNNATCTEDGTKTATCATCGAKDVVVLKDTALGHTPAEAVKENVKNASCATDGSYDSVVYCANGCGVELSRESVTVKATGEHVYATETERVNATCEADGYVVMACGCGLTETTSLDAIGHSYGTPAYAWNDDHTACVATITCANDANHVVTKNGTVTSVTTDATCKVAGKTVYTATFEGEGYATQTAEVELPKLAHTSVTLPAVAPVCLYTGLTEGSYCSACGDTLVEQTVVAATGAAHSWEGTKCTVCKATKFEAETTDITYVMKEGKNAVVSTGTEGKGIEATCYPSGDSFVAHMSDAVTATLKFYVTVSEDCKVTISVRMGLGTQSKTLADIMGIWVDGNEAESYSDTVFPKFREADGATRYYDWYEVVIADLELTAGDHIIEMKKPDTETAYGFNFDYMTIRSADADVTIQDTREKNNGHSYTEWEGDNLPDYDNAGSASAYCDYCRALKTVDLPKVPKVNGDGYEQLSYGVKSVWEYTTNDGIKVTVEVEEPVKKYTYLTVNSDDVLFTSIVDNDETNGVAAKQTNSYGTFYQKTMGATFTFKVEASQATEAILVLTLRGNGTYVYSDIMKSVSVTAGDQTTAGVVNDGEVTVSGWCFLNNTSVEIATINLAEGVNYITFTMGDLNVNIAGIGLNAFADITNETSKEYLLYGGAIADFDPFLEENGGSFTEVSKSDGTKVTGKTASDNSNGVYYQNNHWGDGATYTFTVTVDKDMDVVFYLGLASGTGDGYKGTTDQILDSITCSAGDNSVTRHTSGTISFLGWNAKTQTVMLKFATISLKEGTNTITFNYGSKNHNISALYLQGAEGLAFGTKEN